MSGQYDMYNILICKSYMVISLKMYVFNCLCM